ncbi:unnamed protein product, partial [Staurois parvus]
GTESSGGTAGTESVWQDSGLRVNRHGSGHRVIRYSGLSGLDSGHWIGSPGMTAGIRHQVIWLAGGHRVIWQGSGHRVCGH